MLAAPCQIFSLSASLYVHPCCRAPLCTACIIVWCACAKIQSAIYSRVQRAEGGGGGEEGGHERGTNANEFTISSNSLVNRRYTRFRDFTADRILANTPTRGSTRHPVEVSHLLFSPRNLRHFTSEAYFPKKIEINETGRARLSGRRGRGIQ